VRFITGVAFEVSLTALAAELFVDIPLAMRSRNRTGSLRRARRGCCTRRRHYQRGAGLRLCFVLFTSGPLGSPNLVHTGGAHGSGSVLPAVPIVGTVAPTGLRSLPLEVTETADLLGVTGLRRMRTPIAEVRPALALGVTIVLAQALTERRRGLDPQ
jgi:ABC-type tungstate transport system substrate-binding protein